MEHGTYNIPDVRITHLRLTNACTVGSGDRASSMVELSRVLGPDATVTVVLRHPRPYLARWMDRTHLYVFSEFQDKNYTLRDEVNGYYWSSWEVVEPATP